MPNYEDLKKKAKDAIDTIADISVEAYKIAEEKARVLARRTKLSADITREKATVRRLKVEIGGAYYDLHKDDPEETFKQSCEEITASLDSIAAKRREIEELKNSGSEACCCDCGDEPADAECCPVPEEPAAEEPVAEEDASE